MVDAVYFWEERREVAVIEKFGTEDPEAGTKIISLTPFNKPILIASPEMICRTTEFLRG